MRKLEAGFRKGNLNTIPVISREIVSDFLNRRPEKNKIPKKSLEIIATIDFVQVRTVAEICEVKAIVFVSKKTGIHVSIKVDTKNKVILETLCEQCPKEDSCTHVIDFILWLHRNSSDTDSPAIGDFWGSDKLVKTDLTNSLRISDIFASNDGVVKTIKIEDAEGKSFLEAVLNELQVSGMHDAKLYKHCRPMLDEFEPLFIHHALLDGSNNGINNIHSFLQHMEDQSKQGLFDHLYGVTKTNYKNSLWMEAQYMRLRCSLIHRISERNDTSEDEQILELLFCKHRNVRIGERQKLKLHKRFILKQTEKLENKCFQTCGLLLNESYPYVCASPDGITDDYIVEVKVPKTEEDFEKYLERRETVAPKYMAQIQIQMYMADKTKALYCVLSPEFDINGALHYVWVQADVELVAHLLGAAEDFWKDIVFPRLTQIYLNQQ